MNKQQMLDWRTRQDMRASQSGYMKRKMDVMNEIENREMLKDIPAATNEADLERELDNLMGKWGAL